MSATWFKASMRWHVPCQTGKVRPGPGRHNAYRRRRSPPSKSGARKQASAWQLTRRGYARKCLGRKVRGRRTRRPDAGGRRSGNAVGPTCTCSRPAAGYTSPGSAVARVVPRLTRRRASDGGEHVSQVQQQSVIYGSSVATRGDLVRVRQRRWGTGTSGGRPGAEEWALAGAWHRRTREEGHAGSAACAVAARLGTARRERAPQGTLRGMAHTTGVPG